MKSTIRSEEVLAIGLESIFLFQSDTLWELQVTAIYQIQEVND